MKGGKQGVCEGGGVEAKCGLLLLPSTVPYLAVSY